jgi:hypothetical protein
MTRQPQPPARAGDERDDQIDRPGLPGAGYSRHAREQHDHRRRCALDTLDPARDRLDLVRAAALPHRFRDEADALALGHRRNGQSRHEVRSVVAEAAQAGGARAEDRHERAHAVAWPLVAPVDSTGDRAGAQRSDDLVSETPWLRAAARSSRSRNTAAPQRARPVPGVKRGRPAAA